MREREKERESVLEWENSEREREGGGESRELTSTRRSVRKRTREAVWEKKL